MTAKSTHSSDINPIESSINTSTVERFNARARQKESHEEEEEAGVKNNKDAAADDDDDSDQLDEELLKSDEILRILFKKTYFYQLKLK